MGNLERRLLEADVDRIVDQIRDHVEDDLACYQSRVMEFVSSGKKAVRQLAEAILSDDEVLEADERSWVGKAEATVSELIEAFTMLNRTIEEDKQILLKLSRDAEDFRRRWKEEYEPNRAAA